MRNSYRLRKVLCQNCNAHCLHRVSDRKKRVYVKFVCRPIIIIELKLVEKMSDKLDLGLKDFSQLVSGAAILISFFAGYKYALRNVSSTETKQTSSKTEPDTTPTESLRVSYSFV